jgi:hypothetical protein
MKADLKFLLASLLQSLLKVAMAYPFLIVFLVLLVPLVKFAWFIILKVWNWNPF